MTEMPSVLVDLVQEGNEEKENRIGFQIRSISKNLTDILDTNGQYQRLMASSQPLGYLRTCD